MCYGSMKGLLLELLHKSIKWLPYLDGSGRQKSFCLWGESSEGVFLPVRVRGDCFVDMNQKRLLAMTWLEWDCFVTPLRSVPRNDVVGMRLLRRHESKAPPRNDKEKSHSFAIALWFFDQIYNCKSEKSICI